MMYKELRKKGAAFAKCEAEPKAIRALKRDSKVKQTEEGL
jgi:hypothetical protein